MIRPTTKIKKEARKTARFDRGAAKSTVKDRARSPARVSKNGENGAISPTESLAQRSRARRLALVSWIRSTPTGEPASTYAWACFT